MTEIGAHLRDCTNKLAINVSLRYTWFSGVHHSIPAALRTTERDAVFRFAP